jgi:hypothetical protein
MGWVTSVERSELAASYSALNCALFPVAECWGLLHFVLHRACDLTSVVAVRFTAQ